MRNVNLRRKVALRSVTALMSVALSATMVAGVSPVVAQPVNPSDEEIAQANGAVASAEQSLAQMASTLSEKDTEISNLELEMGGLREAVNKALVDLHDAQSQAEQARQGVTAAKAALDKTQADMVEAQSKLDEVSRTAYKQGATAPGVSGVSGNGNSDDSLDRQTYLRTTAESQRKVIDDLDRLRTQQANEESRLREARNYAEDQESAAANAQKQAQQAIDDASTKLGAKQAEYARLVAGRDQAQSDLDAAKATAAGLDQQRADFEAYQQAEEARKKAEEEAAAAEAARQAAEAAAQQKAQEQAQAAAAAAQAEAQSRAQAQKDAQEKAAAAEAAKAEAAKQAENEQQAQAAKAAAATAASAAAAALVGASQAEHVSLDDPYVANNADGQTPEESSQNSSQALQAAAEAAGGAQSTQSTNQGPIAAVQSTDTADRANSVLADLDVVKLDSTDSVTSKASDLVSDASASEKIETVISRAMSQIGVPYAWGGGDANGPTKGIRDGGVADSYGDYSKVGFDCSGLVLYAFAGVGISLPHYTGYQYQKGTKVDPSQMKRGDLIFYGPNAENHVAIYLGNGQMIEAPNSGSTVRIAPVRWSGMSPYAVRLIS